MASNSQAATSKWQDLGGGEVRLVASLDPASNKVSGIIEVKLKPGWSTYWRYPGSSGIPPEFDFTRSVNFENQTVDYPAPANIQNEYGSYAGYKKRVAFPFEGTFGDAATGNITLDLLIGVCEEICIPAQAEMSIDMKRLTQSDPAAKQAISFARLLVPKWTEAENLIISVRQMQPKTLRIEIAHPSRFGKPDLFVEGPQNWYLQPAELLSQSETSARFELDISRIPNGANPEDETLHYTLVFGQKGIETRR